MNIVSMMLHVIWACNCTFITRKFEKTYYGIALYGGETPRLGNLHLEIISKRVQVETKKGVYR